MLSLSSLHILLAEGNPDEEKIGAFGVGEYHHRLKLSNRFIVYLQASTAYSLSRRSHGSLREVS
jgi:hypothetical protein